MEANTPLIYITVTAVMKKISAVSKDRKNQAQGFAYRGIDDVMNELHPIMAECGLFVVPTVLSEERTSGSTSRGGTMFYTRQRIRYTFYAEDGSSIAAEVIGEAMDSGDKASNKALSVGLKYAMLQLFCIPTEEEKDPDAESPEMAKTAPRANVQRSSSPKQTAPVMKGGASTPEEQKAILELLDSKAPDGTGYFTPADRKNFSNMRKSHTAAEVIAAIQEERDKRYAGFLAQEAGGEVVGEEPAPTDLY